MALVAGSLHEWLAQSPYVRGWDGTSDGVVLNRKKCRATRRKIAGAASVEADAARGSRGSDRPAAADGTKRIGGRKYRRWLNEQLLRDLTPPLDSAEIESLFAPPPWGDPRAPTPLERVAVGSGPDAAGWEPFRAVDMDAQARWMAHHAEHEHKRTTPTAGPAHSLASEMAAWKKLGQAAREALRRNSRSPLLQSFEERLLTYLSDAEEREAELAVEAETAYHRLLLHCLTDFHGLASRTVPAGGEPPGQSLVVIKARDAARMEKKPLHLVDFLREVQRRSSLVEAAA